MEYGSRVFPGEIKVETASEPASVGSGNVGISTQFWTPGRRRRHMGMNVDGAGSRPRAERAEPGSLLIARKVDVRIIAGSRLVGKAARRLNSEGYRNTAHQRV